jgi:hypothetical protein
MMQSADAGQMRSGCYQLANFYWHARPGKKANLSNPNFTYGRTAAGGWRYSV